MKLRYTEQAARELDALLDYLWSHSPQGARHVQDRLKAVLALLCEFPAMGQRTTLADLRRLVVTPFPYIVFYRADGDWITIIGVRHAAQDPQFYPDQASPGL